MTHTKETIHRIVEMWGLGFTAEETRRALREQYRTHVGLATVYRKRHSITAQEIIDELMRKQMRDIARDDNSDLRMKYRDKLLEKLIPQRVESLSVQKIEQHVKIDATEDEDEVLSKAARILDKKLQYKKKLAEVHH